MPPTSSAPHPLRSAIISPDAIRHVMDHPARGTRWSVRELAPRLGCSIGTLSLIRTGKQLTVPTTLAERFSEAVGVETAILFTPVVSAESDTTRSEPAAS